MITIPTSLLFFEYRRFAPNSKIVRLDKTNHLLTPSAPAKLHREWVGDAWAKGLRRWRESIDDCDDWAWQYRAWLLDRHRMTEGIETTIDVAWYLYTVDGGGRHNANAHAVAAPGDGRIMDRTSIQALEPQPNGGPMTLSAAERDSITLLIF